MTGEVYVDGRYCQSIDVSQYVYAKFPPSFNKSAIRNQVYNAVGTVTCHVQIHIPELGILL